MEEVCVLMESIPVSWPRIGKEGGGGMVTRDKAMIWVDHELHFKYI
jgi:hypothetical protein